MARGVMQECYPLLGRLYPHESAFWDYKLSFLAESVTWVPGSMDGAKETWECGFLPGRVSIFLYCRLCARIFCTLNPLPGYENFLSWVGRSAWGGGTQHTRNRPCWVGCGAEGGAVIFVYLTKDGSGSKSGWSPFQTKVRRYVATGVFMFSLLSPCYLLPTLIMGGGGYPMGRGWKIPGHQIWVSI